MAAELFRPGRPLDRRDQRPVPPHPRRVPLRSVRQRRHDAARRRARSRRRRLSGLRPSAARRGPVGRPRRPLRQRVHRDRSPAGRREDDRRGRVARLVQHLVPRGRVVRRRPDEQPDPTATARHGRLGTRLLGHRTGAWRRDRPVDDPGARRRGRRDAPGGSAARLGRMSETAPTSTAAPAAERLVSGPFVTVTFVTFLFFVYVGIQVPLIPRLVEDGLGGSEVDIGLNLAAFSIAAIAVRPLLGTYGDRHGRRILIIAGALLAAAASIASVPVDDRWVLLPLRALAGIGEGAPVRRRSDDDQRSRARPPAGRGGQLLLRRRVRRPRHRSDHRRDVDRGRSLRTRVGSPARCSPSSPPACACSSPTIVSAPPSWPRPPRWRPVEHRNRSSIAPRSVRASCSPSASAGSRRSTRSCRRTPPTSD